MTPHEQATQQIEGYLEAIERDGPRPEHLQSLAYWRAALALLDGFEAGVLELPT